MRKAVGGGMRQSGILAAAGLYALSNNLPKLKRDNQIQEMPIPNLYPKAYSIHKYEDNLQHRKHPFCILLLV